MAFAAAPARPPGGVGRQKLGNAHFLHDTAAARTRAELSRRLCLCHCSNEPRGKAHVWSPPLQKDIQIMVNVRGIRNGFGGIRLGSAGDPGGIRMPLKGILAQTLLPMTHVLHNIKGIQLRPVTLKQKHGLLWEGPHPVFSLIEKTGHVISRQEPHTMWLGEALACAGCFRCLPWTRFRGLTL